MATFELICALMDLGYCVEVLTDCVPNGEVSEKLSGCKIRVFPLPLHGIRWFVRGVITHLHIGWYPNWTLDPTHEIRNWLETFDTICVMSENTYFRQLIAAVSGISVRKVQLIHTDYSHWSKVSKKSREMSRFDRFLYKKFDNVAVVGKPNAERMKKCLPNIADKIVPFHNILKAIERPKIARMESAKIKIVTLSRLNWGPPKKTDACVRVAARLKAAGIKFDWTIWGDGDRRRLDALVDELDVGDVLHMPGYSPCAQEELAKADLSVMLSDYEGLSNGIYEAMMLGVPVFSTNVGGAEEQIADGVNGWLVENDEEKIFKKLCKVLTNRVAIESARKALEDYHYDNDAALTEHLKILGLEEDA